LLDGKDTFLNDPERPFDETFAKYASQVCSVSNAVARLSHLTRFLPGYAPGDNAVSIRVLGPSWKRSPTGLRLRKLGVDSVTCNGHSVVLRIDYDRVRILLTGDSNEAAQRLLLSYHPSQDFTVDVAKGCHHGSDDIELRFVRAIAARTTIVSSGIMRAMHILVRSFSVLLPLW